VHDNTTSVDSHGPVSAAADCSSTDLPDFQSATEHGKKHIWINVSINQRPSQAGDGRWLMYDLFFHPTFCSFRPQACPLDKGDSGTIVNDC
jgi:hypothetical protein